MIVLSENVKKYLWEEFRRNNIPKFYKYFDEWVENLTEDQILFYGAYSEGKKTIEYCIDIMNKIAGVPKDYALIGDTMSEIKKE